MEAVSETKDVANSKYFFLIQMATIFMHIRRRRQENIQYARIHPSVVFGRNERIFCSKYRFRPDDVDKIVRMLSPLLPEYGLSPWEISKKDQVRACYITT